MLQSRDAFRRSAANHTTSRLSLPAAKIPQEPWEESAPGGVGTSGTGAPRPPNLLSRCTIRFKRIARGDADPDQFADFGSQFWPSRLTDLHSQCRFDLIERQSSANESGTWRQRSATGLASPATRIPLGIRCLRQERQRLCESSPLMQSEIAAKPTCISGLHSAAEYHCRR